MHPSTMDLAVRTRRSRIVWTKSMDKALVALLLENVQNGMKINVARETTVSLDLVTGFNEKTGIDIEPYQILNRVKSYKREFKMVKELKKLPGFQWDDKKQRIIGDDVSWMRYFSRKPATWRYIRSKSLACFKDLEIIFGFRYGLGNSSSSDQDIDNAGEDIIEAADRTENTEESKPFLEFTSMPEDPAPINAVQMTDSPILQYHHYGLQSPSASGTIHAEKGKQCEANEPTPLFSKKRDCKGSRYRQDEHMANIASAPETNANEKTNSLETGGIQRLDECIAELDAMERLEDDVYVKALFILRDEYNRCVFLKTSGHRRLAWLRAVTRDVDV